MATGCTREELSHYSENGFLLRRSLLTEREVTHLRDTFTSLGAGGPVPGLSSDAHRLDPSEPLARWPRMMHPHRHPEKPVGPPALRHMLDPRIEPILRDLFAEEPIAAQSMFYFKPPGARGQDFHQDNFYLRVKPGTCIAAWFAIDPADQQNGGLVVIPGTHRMDIACPETSDRAQFFTTEHVPIPDGRHEHPVDMSPGDVLFFNGSLIHGSYPNRSRDRFRRAFICHYIPANCIEVAEWYRPLLRFDGTVIEKEAATGGGPCGTAQAVKGPH